MGKAVFPRPLPVCGEQSPPLPASPFPCILHRPPPSHSAFCNYHDRLLLPPRTGLPSANLLKESGLKLIAPVWHLRGMGNAQDNNSETNVNGFTIMKTPNFAFLLAVSAGLVYAADPPQEIKPGRDRSTNNVPRPFHTNQYSLTNRFGTNDPAFTNRFRTNAPGPIAPRDRNFPPDTFPPDQFPPDRFPPDRFPPDRIVPDRFPPDRFEPDPNKPPVVPPELEPPVRPSVPPPPPGRPAPPKSLTVVPTTPGAVPVVLTVRARSSYYPVTTQKSNEQHRQSRP